MSFPFMYGNDFGPDESNILSEILELTPKDRILDATGLEWDEGSMNLHKKASRSYRY